MIDKYLPLLLGRSSIRSGASSPKWRVTIPRARLRNSSEARPMIFTGKSVGNSNSVSSRGAAGEVPESTLFSVMRPPCPAARPGRRDAAAGVRTSRARPGPVCRLPTGLPSIDVTGSTPRPAEAIQTSSQAASSVTATGRISESSQPLASSSTASRDVPGRMLNSFGTRHELAARHDERRARRAFGHLAIAHEQRLGTRRGPALPAAAIRWQATRWT